MCHRQVSLMDAIATVCVMECSMQGAALLGGVNVLHSAFPDDSDEEYKKQGMYMYIHVISIEVEGCFSIGYLLLCRVIDS